MSRVQVKLTIAMDRDNPKVFLNGAYCFADDTFKRCLGFVTPLIFVYVGPPQKMVYKRWLNYAQWNLKLEDWRTGQFFGDFSMMLSDYPKIMVL